MTKAEQMTFDNILKLIIQQGTSQKKMLDELILVTRMKAAYIGLPETPHERVVRTK